MKTSRKYQVTGGLTLLLAVAILLTGCGTFTSTRKHPDFANKSRPVNTVTMLPPEVEYVHLVFDGNHEHDALLEQSIAETLQAKIPALFKASGYEVREINPADSIVADADTRYELEQLRKAYASASGELYQRAMVDEKDADQFKVTIGPIVNQFADIADSDGIIVARYYGYDKSEGLMTKEVIGNALLAGLTGVYYHPARSGGAIEVALIDGNNGDVLWSNVAARPVEGPSAIASEALMPLPRNYSKKSAPGETVPAAPTKTSQEDSGGNCQRASAEESHESFYSRGKALYDTRNFTLAKECFEKALAEDQNTFEIHESYFHLGMMYELGLGVESDNERARKLYAKAGALAE